MCDWDWNMINSILPEMIGLEIRNKTRPSPCDDHSRSIRHIRSYLGQPFMESTPKSDICLEISVKHFTNKKSFLWIEGVISHTSFVRFASLVTQRHWPTYFRTAQDSRNTSHSFSLGGRQGTACTFNQIPINVSIIGNWCIFLLQEQLSDCASETLPPWLVNVGLDTRS